MQRGKTNFSYLDQYFLSSNQYRRVDQQVCVTTKNQTVSQRVQTQVSLKIRKVIIAPISVYV